MSEQSIGTLEHVRPDASADRVHEILERDGALIIDDLAPIDTIDRIADEMAPYVAATPGGSDDFSGRNTRRTGALVARSPASHELIRHPLILDVTGRLLHRAKSYQLHLTQMISIGPDSPGQQIHRDQWAFDFFDFPADHHVQCNTIWAMTDFTEENGATRVMPGSQALPNSFEHTVDETVPAEMSKGSCLLYTGKVYHGGGANRSGSVRAGLNITYDVAWLRQEENQYLSVPRDIAEQLDDDMLRLMGYQLGAYALGYIDDVRDPLDAIRGGRGAMSFGGRAR
ncbi:MAG: phytanoyl-CoA dioxygenase family protein [Ilumatobacter sp.]|uniref:phytanoyl-CoA dioxygenase family protein n=1 Tax=Ilumatobacter sp. TaxID=1967498 RepID=UPI0026185E59|nr:phytanoyl-CoA dioxygenase family protein [Ilumatobacter sp.]MDJ0770594.1 phytanoyl-CoA dioxygenase family protein [Ilumatobacter sp.]